MLEPSQYQIDEMWIVFQLSVTPIHTKTDGDFNVFGLMDAASCFMLSTELVPTDSAGISQQEARRLLNAAYAHKKEYPQGVFLPSESVMDPMCSELEMLGISVTRVQDEQLWAFIAEARESYEEFLRTERS
jgi:hypothetical protein